MSTTAVNSIRWKGFELDFTNRSAVMGILNITDDSFSDGGLYLDTDVAVARGLQLVAQGADIIDVGAESTRPGSKQVAAAVQIERLNPVIKTLAEKINIPISVDAYNFEVAFEAVKAGASIINDITAASDERMITLAADNGIPIILMHMQGTPATMQNSPKYNDVVGEVLGFLLERAKKCEKFGVPKNHIIIDAGIGFGKTISHNLQLLQNLRQFVDTGYAVLLGASRKRFLGELTGRAEAKERLAATISTSAIAAATGVQIVRVHDVAENLDAVKIAASIRNIAIS